MKPLTDREVEILSARRNQVTLRESADMVQRGLLVRMEAVDRGGSGRLIGLFAVTDLAWLTLEATRRARST